MFKKPKKILIVEDEKPLARALELKLGHVGFETKTVSDGEEALSILKNEKFNLIILDLVIPKLDGFCVLLELKERKNKTPIVIISSLSQEEDIKRAKEFGVKDYFVKSNTPISELVNHIKRVI